MKFDLRTIKRRLKLAAYSVRTERPVLTFDSTGILTAGDEPPHYESMLTDELLRNVSKPLKS